MIQIGRVSLQSGAVFRDNCTHISENQKLNNVPLFLKLLQNSKLPLLAMENMSHRVFFRFTSLVYSPTAISE